MTFFKSALKIPQIQVSLFATSQNYLKVLFLVCFSVGPPILAQTVTCDASAPTTCPQRCIPVGPPFSIQFNRHGLFGGDQDLLWDNVNKLLIVGQGPSVYPSYTQATSGLRITGSILEIHNKYAQGVDMYTHADAGFRAPYINFLKSRGSEISPAAVTYTGYEEESIGGINFGGWDGSGYATSAAIYSQNDENWTPTAHGGHLAIYYTGAGGVNTREVAQFGGADPSGLVSDNVIFYDPLTWGGNSAANPAIYPSSSGSRDIPPVLAVRTGDNSGDAALTALTFRSSVRVFSALVACTPENEGMTAAVSDSSTNVWGSTITGAGSDHVLAYCDGKNWTVAAK